MMRLPEKDHPIWKIVQSLIALAGLIVWVSNENNGVAPHELIGVIAGGMLGKLGLQGWQSHKNG